MIFVYVSAVFYVDCYVVATEKVRRNDFDTISYRLDKLFELKENGVITEEEFVEQKKIILGE